MVKREVKGKYGIRWEGCSMPFLLFTQIGTAAGAYALMKGIPAALTQREAEKINEGANRLLGMIPTGNEKREKFFKLEPMMAVLKKGVLSDARLGTLAVFGVYGAAGLLAATGRRISRASLADRTEKFAVLAILGDGSLAVETLFLACIFICVAGAVLGRRMSKQAEENLKRAYSNLFQAKGMERENRWRKQTIMEEESAGSIPAVINPYPADVEE